VAKKSRPNEGMLVPSTGVLLIDCAAEDLMITEDERGRVTMMIEKFTGGIEIIHCDDRIWWPV
jgi:hypothetical protein